MVPRTRIRAPQKGSKINKKSKKKGLKKVCFLGYPSGIDFAVINAQNASLASILEQIARFLDNCFTVGPGWARWKISGNLSSRYLCGLGPCAWGLWSWRPWVKEGVPRPKHGREGWPGFGHGREG